MRAEVLEIVYTVQVWDKKRWNYYGQRNDLESARERRGELRLRFKRVRIMEHKRTARVVI